MTNFIFFYRVNDREQIFYFKIISIRNKLTFIVKLSIYQVSAKRILILSESCIRGNKAIFVPDKLIKFKIQIFCQSLKFALKCLHLS